MRRVARLLCFCSVLLFWYVIVTLCKAWRVELDPASAFFHVTTPKFTTISPNYLQICHNCFVRPSTRPFPKATTPLSSSTSCQSSAHHPYLYATVYHRYSNTGIFHPLATNQPLAFFTLSPRRPTSRDHLVLRLTSATLTTAPSSPACLKPLKPPP